MSTAPVKLLRRATCPHCWSTFPMEDVVWIAAHADLLGDPRLGADQYQRFLPTRFDLQGNALDAKGFVCHALACPKCHLSLPRQMLETEPFFVSILGTPACGKSYFLTAATWEMRKILSRDFAVSFTDIDTVSNRFLNEYEESLFLNPRPEELISLADLIRKTELQGELYDSVNFGNQSVSYPRPFLFALRPQEAHAKAREADRLARVLCLYDNAGEHFLAGQDSTASPVTQHLAQSRLLLYLYDPTQDQRFRKLCRETVGADRLGAVRSGRQETVLIEAEARVRRYANLPTGAKHDRPLIVVLTKFDAWSALLPEKDLDEPWLRKDGRTLLDFDRVTRRSLQTRALMLRVCPEVVNAAESFAQEVLYVPVSALGHSPQMHPSLNKLAIRPSEIRPIWATVPLLFGLCRCFPGLISGGRRKTSAEEAKTPAQRR